MERQELTNIMELMVKFKYNDIKDILNVCRCKRCTLDLLSFALNKLPAKYVVSEKGEAMAKINASSVQFDSDIICALVEAAKVVKENPRHNDEDIQELESGDADGSIDFNFNDIYSL